MPRRQGVLTSRFPPQVVSGRECGQRKAETVPRQYAAKPTLSGGDASPTSGFGSGGVKRTRTNSASLPRGMSPILKRSRPASVVVTSSPSSCRRPPKPRSDRRTLVGGGWSWQRGRNVKGRRRHLLLSLLLSLLLAACVVPQQSLSVRKCHTV